jgi:hypothetical protein
MSIDWVGPSFTVPQWRKHRAMSRSEWYRRRQRGDNLPDTIGEGRLARVTPAADAKYLAAEKRKARSKYDAA